jgi:peptidyl-prolyl cis-trans isomerase B (cyclophilin B)
MPGSKERQRRRAREHYQRQQARRIARQRQVRKWTLTGVVIAMVAALGVGLSLTFMGGGKPKAAAKPKASATATPSASASATASAAAISEPAHHCTYTSNAGSASTPSLPTATPDYKATYTATINTNRGPISIKLANSTATCAVNSFVHLAQTNFWNSTQCHRVSDDGGLFMLQCGDPTAKASKTLSCSGANQAGSGGPSYTFADEALKGATYPAGTLAMANGGANTNGSQFFLVFKSTALPASYTPFGTITSGLDLLQNVGKAGTTCTYQGAGGGVPKEKVIINSVSIKKA